jgi:hypothetical protein
MWVGLQAAFRSGSPFPRPPPNNSIDPTGEIARLAALSRIEYDRQRRPVAEVLGIRVETLDDEVKQARKAADPAQGAADFAQGKAVVVREVEPWPDRVDGAALFDDISTAIQKHIHLSPAQADTSTLSTRTAMTSSASRRAWAYGLQRWHAVSRS